MAKTPTLKTARRSSGEKNRELESLIQLGTIEETPLDQVDRDDNQPRPLSEVMEGIEEFADELERDDFKLAQLPVYHIKEDGRRMIVVGERRTTAFRLKGKESIPAIVKRFTDEELKQIYILQYVENDGKLKKELSPLADAQWWRNYADLYHEGKLRDAAAARGRSLAEVSNRVSLLNVDPEIVQFIQKNELRDPATYAALGRLAKRGNMNMVRQVFEDYEAGGIKGSLRTYVERLANEVKASGSSATEAVPPSTDNEDKTQNQTGAPIAGEGPTDQKEKSEKRKTKGKSMFSPGEAPRDSGRQALSDAQELLKGALFSADVLVQSPESNERYNAFTSLIDDIAHTIRSLEKAQTHYQTLRTKTRAQERQE